MDRWDVTATTSNSVTIKFSEESYWPTSGTFRGSDNTTYTYTNVSHSGTDAGFQFTGVTPDPSSIFHVRHPSTGVANTWYQGVYAYGLDHVGGDSAEDLGLADSKAFEASGFPLRGIKGADCKLHTGERVVAQLHDVQDLAISPIQVEGGGHVIATPKDSDSVWPNAAGETRNLSFLSSDGLSEMDLRLFLPRSGLIPELQLAPRDTLSHDLVIRPLRSGGETIIEADGHIIKTAAKTEIARYSSNGLRTGGNSSDSPGAGNTTVGSVVRTNGAGFFSRDGDYAVSVNRNSNDGTLVNLRQDGTVEGSISVSGTTVAYNTFCGAHWSQLADPDERDGLVRGTIIETVDALCEWRAAEFLIERPAVIERDDDGREIIVEPAVSQMQRVPYVGPAKIGDTVSIKHEGVTYTAIVVTEQNDHLPKCKVSDVAGSKRVYGVFMAWDEDGDAQIASLGAYLCRIGRGVKVRGGDLLESAGNGTARVQADDAIRSSTIGKVSSTDVIERYADGSYLVSCVLLCG
jgi:hypothetical protein